MNFIKKVLFVINKSGSKFNANLIIRIVMSTLLETLSIGLIMPLIILLSKQKEVISFPFYRNTMKIMGVKTDWLFLVIIIAFLLLIYLFLCRSFLTLYFPIYFPSLFIDYLFPSLPFS